MNTKKYICKECKTEVTDSQKYCHDCGKEFKPLGDAKYKLELEYSYGKENSERDHWRFFEIDGDRPISKTTAIGLAKSAGVLKEFMSFINKTEANPQAMQGIFGVLRL